MLHNNLVYIAHRLGSGEDREFNRKRAARWLAWAANCGALPVAPWITLAEIWDETPKFREKGIAIDLAIIERCDEIWVCGDLNTLKTDGRGSIGACAELAHAKLHEKTVMIFMTENGEPPA